MKPSRDITRLLDIMAALRTPETGCPWDVKQTFASIAPYTIEEAYEVADAIARNDLDDLREELGDLLLQVVFHARIAQERQVFDFGDVVQAITEKLIRRHPHVFGDTGRLSPEEVKVLWTQIKAQEKQSKQARESHKADQSLLDGIPHNMPALMRAEKLQQKAAHVGFDWTNTSDVVAKVHEELAEVEEAIQSGDTNAMKDEIGDLLFAAANLARHLGVDPEAAVRSTNGKFEQRFKYIEQNIEQTGKTITDASLDDMEALWQEAKHALVTSKT